MVGGLLIALVVEDCTSGVTHTAILEDYCMITIADASSIALGLPATCSLKRWHRRVSSSGAVKNNARLPHNSSSSALSFSAIILALIDMLILVELVLL